MPMNQAPSSGVMNFRSWSYFLCTLSHSVATGNLSPRWFAGVGQAGVSRVLPCSALRAHCTGGGWGALPCFSKCTPKVKSTEMGSKCLLTAVVSVFLNIPLWTFSSRKTEKHHHARFYNEDSALVPFIYYCRYLTVHLFIDLSSFCDAFHYQL